MIPKLRFKDYTEDWANKTLGDIGEVRMCKRIFNSETNQSGDIPFYKIGTFGKTADAFIERRLYETYREKYNFPKNGDILISASGTLGRRVRYNGEEAYFQDSNIVWIENNEELVTNEFLYFLYEIVRYDSEGGTIQRLYNSIIKRAKIGVPSIAEQNKITLLLNSIDKKINLLTKKKEALETYKKGLMQKIFSQELRFKLEDGTDYPEWDYQPLGDLAYITSGKSNREDSDTEATYHFFDRSSDVRRSGIYLFDDDSVIVAGEGQEFIPKKFSGKFDLHQRAYAIMKFGDRLTYEYCYYFIFHHRRYFERMAVGTTVLSLRLPMFQKMMIQLPSMEEQDKIVAVFSNLDGYLKKVSFSIQSTESLKKGLLQQMFV